MKLFVLFFFFCMSCAVYEILGIEPLPPTLGSQSLNHFYKDLLMFMGLGWDLGCALLKLL